MVLSLARRRFASHLRRRTSMFRRRRYTGRRHGRSFHSRWGMHTAKRSVDLVRPEQSCTDVRLVRMTTRTTQRFTAGSATGIASQTGCTTLQAFRMNDIWAPGPTSETGFAVAMPQPNGYTNMASFFASYQVIAARITVRVTMDNDTSSTTRIPTRFIIVPASDTLYSTVSPAVATTPFDQMLKVPGRSREGWVCPTADSDVHQGPCILHCFSSPQKMQAQPGFLYDIGSRGVTSSSPTTLPRFMLLGSHINTLPATPTYNVEVSTTYFVRWFNRLPPSLTLEEKEQIPGADYTEAQWDAVPEVEAAGGPSVTVSDHTPHTPHPPPEAVAKPKAPSGATVSIPARGPAGPSPSGAAPLPVGHPSRPGGPSLPPPPDSQRGWFG